MNTTAEFPALSFNCPKLWEQMEGDEKMRFCDVCQKNVHNLSMLNAGERRELLARPGEMPCVAYFKHVDGTPIDVTALPDESPVKETLKKAAVLSLSAAVLMTACDKNLPPRTHRPPSKVEYPMMLGVPCPPPQAKPADVPSPPKK